MPRRAVPVVTIPQRRPLPGGGRAFIRANDPGAEKGLAEALADPLNVRSEDSNGDDGRLPASVPPGMLGAFRTPTLRCVSTRPSFMHTGQLRALRDVVAFFARGGHVARGATPPDGFLGQNELEPLGFDEREIDDLTAFLGALDGPGPAPSLLVPPP